MTFEAVPTHDENVFLSFPEMGWGVLVCVFLTN